MVKKSCSQFVTWNYQSSTNYVYRS